MGIVEKDRQKSKKRKILLGTLIPTSIVLSASITVGALLTSPKISTLLLLKECNGYYQKYRKILETRKDNLSKLENQYKSVDVEVKKIDKELTKLQDNLDKENDANKKAMIQKSIDKTKKELSEKRKYYNGLKKEYQDMLPKFISLANNLQRIFKPMETLYNNIEQLKKDKNMTNALWKKSKLSLEKVKQDYESWILSEYKNI